jgi:hypothetical protein
MRRTDRIASRMVLKAARGDERFEGFHGIFVFAGNFA